MICGVAMGAVLHVTTPPNAGSPSRVCRRGGFMRPAWYAVTAATVLSTACIGPTATGVRGIATLGGTPTDQLAFPVQPSAAVSGQIITPAVQVAARDSLRHPDPRLRRAATVSLADVPP